VSDLKAYTPRAMWEQINQFKSPKTGKLNRGKVNAFLATLDTDTLLTFIRSQKFGAMAQRAARVWLNKTELAHIAHKEQLELQQGIVYDFRSLAPVILDIFNHDISSPFAKWIAAQPGYRGAYLERVQPTKNNPQIIVSCEILEPLAAVASDTPIPAEIPQNKALPAHYGLIDPNMRRIAHELDMWAECQLWEVIQHVADGSGKVDTNTVRSFLQQHGYTDAKFYRVLAAGNGHWWTFRGGLIWYKGYHAIAAMLGARLPADRIAHYRGSNAIGGKTAKRVYAPLTGTKQVFMQNAFAAWIEQRRKADTVTIANLTLATVWNVKVRTIQRWKQLCGQRHNFAEQAPRTDKHQITPDVPPHAVDTPSGGKLYQISSSYNAPDGIKKHGSIGRSQKARRAFYRALSIAQNTDRLSAIWVTEEQSEEKRYWTHEDIDTAFLQVDKTLRKPSSDTFLPRHVLLKGKRRVGVWETVTDTRQRVERVYVA
jgi:hypothetical protein